MQIARTLRCSLLGITIAAAGCAVGTAAMAQATGAPPAQPSTTPAAAPDAAQPESHPGAPRETSAGGAEHKVPDQAGIFEHGPLNALNEPIEQAQTWLKDNARLDLGFRAAFGFQQASGGPGDRTAASQDYRMYGTWHAINFEDDKKGSAGNVYFRTEYRDKIGDIAPFFLNTQIGTLFTTTYGQDEHSLAVVQLYYEQFLFDAALRLRAGKLDPDDYFNQGRWADDYRYFNNTLFSAYPASNHPSGGLGWNAQWAITKEWTLTGGMTDVQGKKTHAGFDTIDDGKFFSAVDVTWSPTFGGLRGNYRVGFEHRDSVPDKDRPQDNSYYVNIDQEVAKDVAPFFRWGHGTGNSTGVDDVVSVGLGIDNAFKRPGDAFGVGFGFDTAHDPAPGARDMEYAGEVFYRFQVTRDMQFMVGAQLIIHPVNAPGDDLVGVYEARLVIDF